MDTGRNKQIRPGRQQSPGRITVDSRGRNVWQWDDAQLDSTTIMLQRLDNSALALEPTRSVRRPKLETGDDPADKTAGRRARPDAGGPPPDAAESASLQLEQTFNVKLGGGFDPYNRS